MKRIGTMAACCFDRMLTCLKALDPAKGKMPANDLNRIRDALIAETAVAERATLITADQNLSAVISEYGGQAVLVP
jgi:hypothetical protein